MTNPIFAAFVRYQGTFIPGVTQTDWWYGVQPIFPGGTTGTPVYTNTGPQANAGLNDIDINNLQWQVQEGAIGYNIFRAAATTPGTNPINPATSPIWFSATAETGIKDKGYPAATRS